MKDFYYILGLDANCTAIEVREAYRKLSKKFHPDVNDADGYFENRFKQISEAYETLNDPRERTKYDAALKKVRSYPEEVKKEARVFKTTYINIAFSLTLLFITLLFGYYVAKSFTGAKRSKIATEVPVAVTTPKHHKKKRGHKNKAIESDIAQTGNKPTVPVKKPDTIKKYPVLATAVVKKTTTSVPKPIKDTTTVKTVKSLAAVSTAPKKVIAPVIANNVLSNNDPQAAAYIKANLTGVVNMRRLDSYNSDIVSVIPDKSKIVVLERGSNYYKVMFDNKTGYVPRWTVRTE